MADKEKLFENLLNNIFAVEQFGNGRRHDYIRRREQRVREGNVTTVVLRGNFLLQLPFAYQR